MQKLLLALLTVYTGAGTQKYLRYFSVFSFTEAGFIPALVLTKDNPALNLGRADCRATGHVWLQQRGPKYSHGQQFYIHPFPRLLIVDRAVFSGSHYTRWASFRNDRSEFTRTKYKEEMTSQTHGHDEQWTILNLFCSFP